MKTQSKNIVAVLANHDVAFRRYKGAHQKQNEVFVKVSSVADTAGKEFDRVEEVPYYGSVKDARAIRHAALSRVRKGAEL